MCVQSTKHKRSGLKLGRSASLLAICAVLAASPAAAAGTEAGTEIKNTATATFALPGGGSGSVLSNTVTTVVDELIDVTVVWGDPSPVLVFPDGVNQILTFNVTNTGNYNEAFALSTVIGSADFNPAVTSIVLDNGNGIYEPGVDLVYQPGVNDPLLAANETITVFVLSTIPNSATDQQQGNVVLIATSTTASGAPGTTVEGIGPNGSNVVVGASGGDADDNGFYVVNSATVTLVKSASVVDPFGGSNRIPGAIITYSLVANVSGTGTLAGLAIEDGIPAGTIYVNNSLKLEGGALTDAADGDRGSYDGSKIKVDLGDLTASAMRTVSFQVKIDTN